jgi:CheY-like chemotaxis protein
MDVMPTTQNPTTESPLVLIVDDDPDTRLLLTALLGETAYRTAVAGGGREALASLGKHHPAVVLLDLFLPGMDGREVLRRIRRSDPDTGVVIVTGHGDEKTAASLLRDGADDYLPKPIDRTRLIEGIGHALARRGERQRRREEAAEGARTRGRLLEESRALREAVAEQTRELVARERKLEAVNHRLRRANLALVEKCEETTRLEKIYHEVFDKAGDGIVKLGLNGKVLMANPKAMETLGRRPLRGEVFAELVSERSRIDLERLLVSLGSGRVIVEELDVSFPGQDGERTLSLRAVPLWKKGAVREVEIIMTEVTERMYLQDMDRKRRERSIVAGLSRHLSHVLLNALVGAGGYVAKIRKGLDPEPRRDKQFDIVRLEMQRMEDVVRGYQDYVETMRVSPVSLRLADDVLKGLAAMLAGAAGSDVERVLRPVRQAFHVGTVEGDTGPAAVLVDSWFLELGLAYLVRGAVHHGVRAGKRAATLAVRSRRNDHEVAFDVVLVGLTTPADDIARMFKPWEHQMLSQVFDDWGVNIANAVAERHQGRLEIGTVEEGTRFSFILPAVEVIGHKGAGGDGFA